MKQLLRNNQRRIQYDWKNNVLGGVRRHKDRLYLSVPRWKGGVVATLNVVGESGEGDVSAPKLRPFPNLAANEAGDCRSFQESDSTNGFHVKS